MEFSITNVALYGLAESIIASGYPKSLSITDRVDKKAAILDNDFKRAKKLGKVPGSTGHDCFLKGIIMQCDLTASHAFWIQWQRHHFQDIVSSQSKMHKILDMDINEQCNKYVRHDVIVICEDLVEAYKKEPSNTNFLKLIYNLPLGLMLTARITDNYLSLKTQYYQRRNEKLGEWRTYCEWIEKLPYFKELVLGE